MQLNISIILAALATVRAGTIPAQQAAEKVNVTATGRSASKAFSVSEWSDRGCGSDQQTWALKDKKCYEPSSTSGSLELWYLDPGCKLGLYKNYCGDDKNIAIWDAPTYQCIDLKAHGITHYQLYC